MNEKRSERMVTAKAIWYKLNPNAASKNKIEVEFQTTEGNYDAKELFKIALQDNIWNTIERKDYSSPVIITTFEDKIVQIFPDETIIIKKSESYEEYIIRSM